MYGVGKLLIELVVVLAGVGLIVGCYPYGLSGTLVNDLPAWPVTILVVALYGRDPEFVLGIGMTVTAAYIFGRRACPGLGESGLKRAERALVHSVLGDAVITPPVALGAYAAASTAEANR